MTVIQEQDRKTIDLETAVVMPDHIHMIFRVIESHTLRKVLQGIEDRSSRQINQAFGRKGRVWLVESFDHIIWYATSWKRK